jgi:hypothetical protein
MGYLKADRMILLLKAVSDVSSNRRQTIESNPNVKL